MDRIPSRYLCGRRDILVRSEHSQVPNILPGRLPSGKNMFIIIYLRCSTSTLPHAPSGQDAGVAARERKKKRHFERQKQRHCFFWGSLRTADFDPVPDCPSAKGGSGANCKGDWVTVMIWKKWVDDERVKRHEGSVCRATFRPGCHHPLCALVPMLQAQLPRSLRTRPWARRRAAFCTTARPTAV